MYDTAAREWYAPWAHTVGPGIELLPLARSGKAAGTVTAEASRVANCPQASPSPPAPSTPWPRR